MPSGNRDDRGVSEVIGFTFIFALVMLSIVVVSVTGYAGLEHVRDAERVNNAERAFDVLADNVDDVVRHGAPSRSTEVKLEGASLSLGDPVTVRVTGATASGPVFDRTVQTRPLVYDAGTGTRLVYVNGAVIREDPSGAVMLRAPDLHLTADETALAVVAVTPTAGTQSVAGSTTVNVRTTRTGTDVVHAETEPTTVTYELTSDHPEVWAAALDEAVGGSCARSGATVSCTVHTDRVFVTVAAIEVRID